MGQDEHCNLSSEGWDQPQPPLFLRTFDMQSNTFHDSKREVAEWNNDTLQTVSGKDALMSQQLKTPGVPVPTGLTSLVHISNL